MLEDPDSPPSYKDLAKELDLSVSNVTNYLAAARREFRRIVLEKLRELTATDEEFRREARALLEWIRNEVAVGQHRQAPARRG